MEAIRSIAIPPLTPDLERVLIDADTIQRRVTELANQINNDYANITEPLILVGVLKGSFIYLADLCRKLTVPHVVDFIAVSSYGKGSETTGNVRLLMDTGYTLDYLVRNFIARGTKSVNTTVLLEKPDRHKVHVDLKYVGFTIPDVWVVGFGLDYGEQYRTLPYIAEMKIPKKK